MFADNNEEKTTKIGSDDIPTIMERPSKPAGSELSAADAKTMIPPPPPAAQSAPAPQARPVASSGEPWVNRTFGSLLSGMGIANPQTQRYTVYGAGGLVVLCCGCSCLSVIAYFGLRMMP